LQKKEKNLTKKGKKFFEMRKILANLSNILSRDIILRHCYDLVLL